jgi:hypothetical protein
LDDLSEPFYLQFFKLFTIGGLSLEHTVGFFEEYTAKNPSSKCAPSTHSPPREGYIVGKPSLPVINVTPIMAHREGKASSEVGRLWEEWPVRYYEERNAPRPPTLDLGAAI